MGGCLHGIAKLHSHLAHGRRCSVLECADTCVTSFGYGGRRVGRLVPGECYHCSKSDWWQLRSRGHSCSPSKPMCSCQSLSQPFPTRTLIVIVAWSKVRGTLSYCCAYSLCMVHNQLIFPGLALPLYRFCSDHITTQTPLPPISPPPTYSPSTPTLSHRAPNLIPIPAKS